MSMERTRSFHGAIIKRRVARIIMYILLTAYALLCLFPFVWSSISSLKENDEILIRTFSLPTVWKFENYPNAWVGAKMGMYFVNTSLYAVIATTTLLVITPMAAYVIARVKKSLLLYTFYTLGIMIPVHTTLLPSFILIRGLSLTNTRLSIILVYIAFNISISVFILVGFMRGIPKELEEAAFVDGCSRTYTFFKIIYPLSKPGLATIGILAFLNNWNDFLVPLILLTQDRLKVITQGVQELRGQYAQDYGLLTAGIVISFMPVVILYILFQEQMIRGLTAGALKG
jgi:raffinose/stachyose/melibiose transport system permease protein